MRRATVNDMRTLMNLKNDPQIINSSVRALGIIAAPPKDPPPPLKLCSMSNTFSGKDVMMRYKEGAKRWEESIFAEHFTDECPLLLQKIAAEYHDVAVVFPPLPKVHYEGSSDRLQLSNDVSLVLTNSGHVIPVATTQDHRQLNLLLFLYTLQHNGVRSKNHLMELVRQTC